MMKALLILSALVLAGCSSTPPKMAKPYCNTSQEITVKNGQNVSSETVISCNDDPVAQFNIKKVGISKKCFNDTQRIQLPNGRIIVNEAYACQKPDGTWIHINPN
jgi:putative hemolysin